MKKKTIAYILSSVFIVIIIAITFLTYRKLSVKHESLQKRASALSIPLLDLDSVQLRLVDDNKATLLIYFNSTCDHCQRQVADIKDDAASVLQKFNVVMASSELITDIRSFEIQSGLSEHDNVTFAKINSENIYDTFGSVAIPHIFIYDADFKLVKEFKGETKVQDILSSAND